ncbi:hypothetical protein H2O73_14715 [Vibrio sp. 404]|uniref:Uncharacterized protein n=1 Tax=Vibrio marinisediminis TaxID=2758441 RepID=A0A7W2IUS9_9VIBR|nr:hypothetical protein [Vibrio marinisediminis]MBA5763613.1 hypothetical protein [Vibrio marinisediminis]
MNLQRGAVTIIVTSVLLSAMLLLVMGSYRATFHQIKVGQNELKSRVNHWQAEGAIECLFTYIQTMSEDPANLTQGSSHAAFAAVQNICLSDTSRQSLFTKLDALSNYRLIYRFDGVDLISKTIVQLVGTGSGVIQSRGPLILNGSLEIWPDVTGKKIDGQDECVAIRYAQEIDYTYSGSGLQTVNPLNDGPYAGYAGVCHQSTKTNLSVSKNSASDPSKVHFKNDMIKDSSLDPFRSFFGSPRSQLNDVRASYKVIAGSKSNCDQLIANAFASTDKVWVQGDCDLGSGHALTLLPNTPRKLVVENGVFGVYSAVVFYGAMYHLYQPSTPVDLTANWSGTTSGIYLPASHKSSVAHFQAGSFVSTGGLILDLPNTSTYFFNSMVFKYDRSASGSGGGSSSYVWLKGSWSDL